MTTLGNKQLPADAVTKEVERLKEQALRLGANVKAQAGLPLDKAYSGYADPRYFDKSSPYYTGATRRRDAPAPGTGAPGRRPARATGRPSRVRKDIAKRRTDAVRDSRRARTRARPAMPSDPYAKYVEPPAPPASPRAAGSLPADIEPVVRKPRLTSATAKRSRAPSPKGLGAALPTWRSARRGA